MVRSEELRDIDAQTKFCELEIEQQKLTQVIDEVTTRNRVLEQLLEDKQMAEVVLFQIMEVHYISTFLHFVK